MNRSDAKRTILQMFRKSLMVQSDVPGPHVVDNEPLLARWSQGSLGPAERETLVSHLAACAECREVVERMLEAGALELPEVAVEEPVTLDRRSLWRSPAVWVLAAAAAVLLMIMPRWFFPDRTTELAMSLSLQDFGYALDGRSYGKTDLPVPSAERAHRLRELTEALADRPQDGKLLLEYGCLLLQEGRAADARRPFEAAVVLEPRNVYALTGLGVTLYELRQYQEARQAFQQAASLDPQRLVTQLNAAICLERLGLHDLAVPYWKRAYQLANQPTLRAGIQQMLTTGN